MSLRDRAATMYQRGYTGTAEEPMLRWSLDEVVAFLSCTLGSNSFAIFCRQAVLSALTRRTPNASRGSRSELDRRRLGGLYRDRPKQAGFDQRVVLLPQPPTGEGVRPVGLGLPSASQSGHDLSVPFGVAVAVLGQLLVADLAVDPEVDDFDFEALSPGLSRVR